MQTANKSLEDMLISTPEFLNDPLYKSGAGIDSVHAVLEHYKTSLWQCQKPLNFLNQLGIASPGLIDRFHIGFSDRTLGKCLPPSDSAEGEFIRGELREQKLLLWSGHELMRNCITVAEVNQYGVCEQIYARRLGRRQPEGTPREPVWFLGNPRLFNLPALENNESLILCDNPLDMIILYAVGFGNVISTAGLNSFDENHLEDIHSAGIKSVTIAYGNTVSENHYALLVSQAFDAFGVNTSRLILPLGMDIQRYVLRHGNQGLSTLIHEAIPCKQSYEALLGG